MHNPLLQDYPSFDLDYSDLPELVDHDEPDASPPPPPGNQAAVDPAATAPAAEPAAAAAGDPNSLPRRSERVRHAPDFYQASIASVEPTTFEQAMASPDASHWKLAMDDEMALLKDNDTYILEPLPPGSKAIPVRWLSLSLLALVVSEDMVLRQLDVKTAFLNGELEKTIYMQQPPGYEEGGTNTVCHLQRALYGLRQAPRAWHAKLKSTLEKLGFTESESDPGLFSKQVTDIDPTYVLAYVDDMLLASKELTEVQMTIEDLAKEFDIKVRYG